MPGKITEQEKFWQSKFGEEYTDRNFFTPEQLDEFYYKTYGVTRTHMNNEFLKDIEVQNILEVGANCGNQLWLLQKQGFNNLYGIEVLDYAVEKAKQLTKNIKIIQGSGFDIPFKDNYFDLVFTSGALIHIHPNDIKKIMTEIYRVSKMYIWGFEYYDDKYIAIEYRGNKERLWKSNFAKMYCDICHNVKLIKEIKYKHTNDNNIDSMFLLKKYCL